MIILFSAFIIILISLLVGFSIFYVLNKEKKLIEHENKLLEEEKEKELWKDKISLSSDK